LNDEILPFIGEDFFVILPKKQKNELFYIKKCSKALYKREKKV